MGVGNGITYDAYGKGFKFVIFDTTGDQSDGWHLIKSGNTTLSMEFADMIPAGGIKLIVYLEYENCLFINHNREPYFDFSQ
jgi:hypothetical protein